MHLVDFLDNLELFRDTLNLYIANRDKCTYWLPLNKLRGRLIISCQCVELKQRGLLRKPVNRAK